jgi:hypothetical protein
MILIMAFQNPLLGKPSPNSMTQDSIQAIRFYLREEKRGKVNSLFFN